MSSKDPPVPYPPVLELWVCAPVPAWLSCEFEESELGFLGLCSMCFMDWASTRSLDLVFFSVITKNVFFVHSVAASVAGAVWPTELPEGPKVVRLP